LLAAGSLGIGGGGKSRTTVIIQNALEAREVTLVKMGYLTSNNFLEMESNFFSLHYDQI